MIFFFYLSEIFLLIFIYLLLSSNKYNIKLLVYFKIDIDDQNIILWMDHRAKKEADDINQTKHQILKYVGGHVSLEMVIPKVLWLKRNHSRCWKKAHHYFLLNDFLTWKCTGEEYRY